MRKHIQFCQNTHFLLKGFTVQPGFLYGNESKGTLFVSNGKEKYNHQVPFFNAYLYNLDTSRWSKARITEISNPEIFNLISKAVQKRAQKGIQVEYRTSDELETERWTKDENAHFFPHSVPYKASKCNIPEKYANSNAKFRTSKERGEITQRVNTVYYNSCNGNVTII